MYKPLILLFCFSLIIPAVSLADGLPDVQAVCKIELKDGKTIEGVILVARGSYNRYYDTNGFYLVLNEKVEKVILFNTDFFAIQPSKGIVENSPTFKSGWGLTAKKKGWFENPKVYYIHDITSEYLRGLDPTEVKVTADTLDSTLLLKRDITHHIAYELLEYLPVFTEVPQELCLSQTTSIQPLHINTKEIQRFELVLEPSQKWLDQISSATKEYVEAHSSQEEWEGLLPEWFHQMMKEKDKYKALFKPWQF